jgi:hypothetical protein
MATVDSISIFLILLRPLHKDLPVLLDAFEASPEFVPTHWGPTDSLRDPYGRKDLCAYIDAERRKGEESVPSLRRVVHPRYVATWSAMDRLPTWLEVRTTLRLRPEDPPLFFDFAASLAERLAPDFGLVNLDFEGVSRGLALNAGGLEHVGAYVDRGPSTLYARNFLSARLVALAGGLDALRASRAAVTPREDGGCVLDLLPNPWTQPPAALKVAQHLVVTHLQSTAIFDRTRWEPPPLGALPAGPRPRRDNPVQIADDARNLRQAADRDIGSLQKALLEAGHDPASVEAAMRKIQERNEQIGVYDLEQLTSLLK